jgi:hypothetical protein
MNGFRCRVQNGVVGASIPRPEAPRRGQPITRATQPMYWANSNSNLDYTPSWSNKPSYNSAFGWVNGAQTSAFGAGSGNGGGGGGSSPTTSRGGNGGNGEWTPSTTSSSRRGRPTSDQGGQGGQGGNSSQAPAPSSTQGNGPEFPNYAAQPTVPDTDDDIPQSTASAVPTGGSGSGKRPCKSKKRRSRARRHHAKRQASH